MGDPGNLNANADRSGRKTRYFSMSQGSRLWKPRVVVAWRSAVSRPIRWGVQTSHSGSIERGPRFCRGGDGDHDLRAHLVDYGIVRNRGV
jgi:hypothetical protein